MSKLVINDLHVNKEFDSRAMKEVLGGNPAAFVGAAIAGYAVTKYLDWAIDSIKNDKTEWNGFSNHLKDWQNKHRK